VVCFGAFSPGGVRPGAFFLYVIQFEMVKNYGRL